MGFFSAVITTGVIAHLIIWYFGVVLCAGCSDAELHSLAAKLKDWFGVLHLDANRDLKSPDSFDSTAGRECFTSPLSCFFLPFCISVRLLQHARDDADVDADPAVSPVMSTCFNTSQLSMSTLVYTLISLCCCKVIRNDPESSIYSSFFSPSFRF